ncbi:stearoyl-CoA desaturase (Delta-9 desaturase), partial [Phenoliferia sp. Uapishka_3]
MHLMALVGAFHPHLSPWWDLDRRTLAMCIISWQLAIYGITLGYHRLWSHKSFTASFPLRVVLAGMGCLGFQGSIRWWVLRHRLHHRFTDTESDPYNATQGLYHSHMGWIFRKPEYPRMALVDRKDLDADPVVRFQHKHYLALTLGLGLVLPTAIGWSYGDALGGYIWGGIVARLMIWHCTFCINSLAHLLGDQEYNLDLTARGNFLLAMITGGEAFQKITEMDRAPQIGTQQSRQFFRPANFRRSPAFPHHRWAIYLLHHFTPLIPKIHQTPPSEILKARAHVLLQQSSAAEDDSDFDPISRWSAYASATSSGESSTDYGSSISSDEDSLLEVELEEKPRQRRRGGLPSWTRQELALHVAEQGASTMGRKPIVLILEGYAVDATHYASNHPGGMAPLMDYAVKPAVGDKPEKMLDSTAAFSGGLNVHGWSAKEKMRSMRIARVIVL